MTNRPKSKKWRWLLWFLVAGLVTGGVFAAWGSWRPKQRSAPANNTFPLPSYTESRFLNTGAEAQYVGTAACVRCHLDRHQSYLLTAHSRSLSDLDPKVEPPDGSFQHEASGHTYRVYRQNGQFRHEEVLRTAEGKEISRIDLPIRYLVGSGNFSRSYLIDLDGFLHESPITWYTSKKQWGMSPGYHFPIHASFEREVTLGCLACHTGRAEINEATHRFAIHEQAIGCENCHGPGSLHEALRNQTDKPVPGTEDLTIVNPARLSRPRLESLCGECHLNGPARVYLRGRKEGDFRPGMPLTDYHLDYRFDTGNDQMTVVGHLEQLRRSPCYQKSKDLTCLTCHDPHAPEKPKDTVAFYRQKCLTCHTTQSCGLEPAQRLRKDATDNCVACHMPRGDTDIPHIAFTHHRIGLHTAQPPADTRRVPELVPTEENPHLTPWDRKRNLGLAYIQATWNGAYPPSYRDAFAERARELLEGVQAKGLHDIDTVAGLAELYLAKDPARCRGYAQQVLDTKDAPVLLRADALNYLASFAVKERNCVEAIKLLKELVLLRRHSDDWHNLAVCYLVLNRPWEALAALEQSLALRPDKVNVHFLFADAYDRVGDVQHAKEHREKANWLRQHSPK